MSAAGSLSVPRLEGAVEALFQSNFDADTLVYLTTLLKVVDNVLSQPYNPKVRQLRSSNPAVHSKLLSRTGGRDVLLACGFAPQREPPPLLSHAGLNPSGGNDQDEVLVFAHDDVSFLRSARRVLVGRLQRDLNVSPDKMPKEPPAVVPVTAASLERSNFNVYAGHRYDAASAALGVQVAPDAQHVSKTETALQALTDQQRRLERQLQAEHVDRNWTAVRPGEAASAPSSAASSPAEAAPPPTKSDGALLAAKLQKQQRDRTRRETGFTTQAMRDLERLQKAKVYSHTVLTLQFPDGSKVLGCFGPNETIAGVQEALLHDCFVASAATAEFDLIQTPPRRVLDPKQSLQQLGLVPAAKVVVSWRANAPNGCGASEVGWYLEPHLFQSAPSGTDAVASALFPASRPVLDPNDSGKELASAATSSSAAAEAPPPESREEALLRRMMGGGGGGRKLGGGGKTGAAASTGASLDNPKDPPKKPKWFKG